LLAEHPVRERLRGLHMIALYRGGRVAEALQSYHDGRRLLVDELGVEPTPALQQIHLAITQGRDPGPSATAARALSKVDVAFPRNLPPDLPGFVGRAAQVSAIVEAAGRARGLALWSISGMGGTGKTRLAVHAAHLLAARYPDGQLYVDLSGPARVAPETALEHLLKILGVPGESLPHGLAARSAALRDRLAGRRVLIVIDDALDDQQVLPLLPSGPGCAVIVTSRRVLTIDGAASIGLGMFSPEESVSMLDAVVGGDRVGAEIAQARRLAELCGHLPLALSLAAQRIRARPTWPVGYFADRLADERRRLDELAVGDRAVNSAFSFSYRGLSPAEQVLFRRLALHPGRDITAPAAAALVSEEVDAAEAVLESLLDQNLLQQAAPGRYQLHELLRAFAFRQASGADSPGERDESTTRLLDWYAHATDAATRPLRRFQLPIDLNLPVPKTPVPEPHDADGALRWLDSEYPNLIACMRLACDEGWYAHAVQMGQLLQPYLVRRRPAHDFVAAMSLAHAAAVGLGQTRAVAHTLTELGNACLAAGEIDRALRVQRKALSLHAESGDTHGQALSLNHLGTVSRRLGDYEESASLYRQSVEMFTALQDRARLGSTCGNLAISLHLAGRHEEALSQAGRALSLSLGEAGEAPLRTNLAIIYAQLGRHEEAVAQALAALELHEAAGSSPGAANTLTGLGVSYSRLGRFGESVRVSRRAAEIARRVARPDLEASALNTLGEAYELAGRPARAWDRHTRALALAAAVGDAEEHKRAEAGLRSARPGPRVP
jgi:tetratricopeptide (TPR) repeat protein